MSSTKDTEEYYQTIMLLQEKLRQSEEERLNLEIKYNEIIQHIKEEEEAHLKKIRFKYKQFLEEDRRRQQRNDKILDALDRIENRSKMWEAKSKKFKAFRNRYQHHLKASCEIDDCDDIFKSCLQSSIYSTKSNVKPEDNLGNVNSIYSKTLKIFDHHDNNKISKDLENSLKQAVKPDTTPYLTRLETDEIKENYWEKSAEQVHNDLKRLLNEERKLSLINKFGPTEVVLLNEASPTKTDESKVLNVNQKDKANCVGSIKLTSSIIQPEIGSKPYNLENQSSSKKEEFEVDGRKHIIETVSNEYEMPGEKQRGYEKVMSPKTMVIEKNRKTDCAKTEAEINQKSTVHEQTFEQNGEDIIPIQTVKAPDEQDFTSTQNLNITEVTQSDDVIQKATSEYSTLQTDTAIDGESDVYVEQSSDQTVREQIDEDRHNLEDDKKIEEIHYETESQFENLNLQPQLAEQNDQMYDENRHGPEHCDDSNVNVKQYEDSDRTITQYDENGQPIPSYDQPYQEYDGNYYDENQTQERYYNQTEEYQYDENGQLIQQYDEHGQPLQQYYENEMLQYDENGQPILQYDQNALYDENGQMLQYNPDQQYHDYNTRHGEQLDTQNNEIEQVVSESINENIVQSPLESTNLENAIN